MKEIIFDKNNYKDYKDMYKDICKKLDKDRFIDWNGEYENLGYNADLLNEFLWYCHDDNVKYIFKNFDLERIEQERTHDDYQYKLLVKIFKRFAKEYPNNAVEFK